MSNLHGKSQTRYLNQTPSASAKSDPGTASNPGMLSPAWMMILQVGSHKLRAPISESVLTVGRKPEADTSDINWFDLEPVGAFDHGVSRKHAEITFHDGELYIQDLNSTNGTRINGFQLADGQKYRLRDGDEIQFASLCTTITFVRRPT